MSDRFYATTPIYYVNDKPHIGHAYCTILADATRRFHELLGEHTYFCTGTDEHGQKVQEAAAKRGIPPQRHVDELHVAFKELLPGILCEPDQFIRTTEARHVAVVRGALSALWEKGLIYESQFEGWYSPAAERYWTDKDLVDGRCPDTGQEVVRLSEKAYFFKMSLYGDRIAAAIRDGAMKILPANRGNEVLGFLHQGLKDLCISRPKRRLSWGIELPFDPDFVCYVWFDALLNYVTAIGGLGAPTDRLPDGDFASWWPAVHHFLGKDILTTHAVYWPAMLMALGLPLPSHYVVTGWWLMDDTKMSKSLGNVISPLAMKDRYGPEVLRYFLLREMAVGQDANFSEEALVGRNNSDLANDLGNLVSRTTALAHQHFEGRVPAPPADREPGEALRSVVALGRYLVGGAEADREACGIRRVSPVRDTLAAMKLHVTLADIMLLVQGLNRVLASDQPFKTIRTDRDAAALTLYHVLEGIRFAANLLWPVMPDKCTAILERIGSETGIATLDELHWGELRAGAELRGRGALFPRYKLPGDQTPAPGTHGGRAKKAKKNAKKNATREDRAVAGEKSRGATDDGTIAYDEFARLDLRVGLVVTAEDLPKSRKLLRLEVDLGELGTRQVLAGIKEHVRPEELLGTRVVVLANLAPRRIMGLQSQGMMLAAEADGALAPLTLGRDLPPGSKVG